MTRPVLFILDTINRDGDHLERYLSLTTHGEDVPITAVFFNEVLTYFNSQCEECEKSGYLAVDITRIFDNGIQVYFDHENDIEEQ